MFSLRIVTTNYYLAKPIPGLDATQSEFRNAAVRRVPVLRIFGSTPAGQKTCMHIHGVFPYLYVPYDGTQPVNTYLKQFAVSLDKALNVANRSANSNIQHVFKISIVSGIPMYGYHPQEENFLKIYLINPSDIRKAADLLLGGAVMNKPFQPHEAHIPWTLQLFMDYNLHGMNLVNVAAVKFRRRGSGDQSDRKNITEASPSQKEALTQDTSLLGVLASVCSHPSSQSSPMESVWHEENIPREFWLPADVERQTRCELEVDVVAADITNRQELAGNIGANPGLAAIWEDERQRRKDAGGSSQLEPESSQERIHVFPSESEKKLMKRFQEIVQKQQMYRSNSLDESLPSQPASQVESHVSRNDSLLDSQDTVDLGEAEGELGDADQVAIVNMKFIDQVVSCSDSFSRSQSGSQDTHDQNVANILAALLAESGPAPPRLTQLEDQDSVLNQTLLLDPELEQDDERETTIMSQVVQEEDDRLDLSIADSEELGSSDVVMNTDVEEEDDDELLLPQFDGASDKLPGPRKTLDQNPASTITQMQNPGTPQGDTPQIPATDTSAAVDPSWRAGGSAAAGRIAGNSQSFSPDSGGPWLQSPFPTQSGSGGGHAWPSWSQQQQCQAWPHQQQQVSRTYPHQHTYHPTSPAATFQSPTHNPYTSPTHHHAYQTPSPSVSHSQYQFPPYHSLTSDKLYQQPYHSPYQSPGHGKAYHSPQAYHSSISSSSLSAASVSATSASGTSSNQPYQSSSANQQFQSPSANQQFQSPAANQQFQSPSTNQQFQSPSANQQFQSPSGIQPYQSPSANQSYQSASAKQPYSPMGSASQSYQVVSSSEPFVTKGNQSYQSPSVTQPYQSPPATQPYQSPPATQPYQSPTVTQPYQSPTVTQPYQSPSVTQPHQSLTVTQPCQSPTVPQPYQSSSATQPYQSPQECHGHVYPPSYSHMSSSHPYSPSYQSQAHTSRFSSPQSWSPQSYQTYYQSQQTNSAGLGKQRPSINTQGSTSDANFGPGVSLVRNCISPDGQQTHEPVGSLKQPHVEKYPGCQKSIKQESFCGQSTMDLPVFQKKKSKKGKDKMTTGGFKSPQILSQSPVHMFTSCVSRSPTPVAHARSPFDFKEESSFSNFLQSSNITVPPLSVSGNSSSCLESPLLNKLNKISEANHKSKAVSGIKVSETPAVTKISTLEFNPSIAHYSVPPVNIEPNTNRAVAITTSEQQQQQLQTPPKNESLEKFEASTSTPMIQQLLMEEPMRMNIRKEDREAAMKKPVSTTIMLKPKRKYTRKTDVSTKKLGRPRSTSLSSPAVSPSSAYTDYTQPILPNPPLPTSQDQPSHRMSFQFNSEPVIPSSMSSYAWTQQQQWKQQNFSPAAKWQPHQHHHIEAHNHYLHHQQLSQQWEINDWQSFGNSGQNDAICSEELPGPDLMTSRIQQRSLSSDSSQPPIYEPVCLPDQTSLFSDSETSTQNNLIVNSEAVNIDRESVHDKSSLSSLLQLVSDVGSDDIDWEQAASTVIPNMFPNSCDPDSPKSTPTSETEGSPLVKDFITLEAPSKQNLEITSDTAGGVTSSEESDRTDYEISCDLKPRILNISYSAGSSHPQVGKQNRLRKLGLTQSTEFCSLSGPVEPNPSYTYTFQVPTPICMKMKFFKGAESRKHNIKVVRMHPMDARRYSLLKIGREVVKVVRLTDNDLVRYHVSVVSPFPFVSADGSTNRVNLDIPVVSLDKHGGLNGSEESSLSKFDTDFPPNKVAPPSSFQSSQATASLSRASSAMNRSPPVSSDWLRQLTAQTSNYNGRFSPGSQGVYSPSQSGLSPSHSSFNLCQPPRDGATNSFLGRQMIQPTRNRRMSGAPSTPEEPNSHIPEVSQKGNSLYPHSPASSSILTQDSTYHSQPSSHSNHTHFPQHRPYFPHQHYPPSFHQQPQTDYSSSNQEPKNGLRSPGQHGLTSTIDSRRVPGHSGHQETERNPTATENLPVNTRVNAQNWHNHADHLANQQTDAWARLCSQECDNTEAYRPSCHRSVDLSVNVTPDDSINQSVRCQPGKNKSELLPCDSSRCHCPSSIAKQCKFSDIKQHQAYFMGVHQRLDKHQLGRSINSHWSKLELLTCGQQLNDDFRHDHHVKIHDRQAWRKNIKALRLRIPTTEAQGVGSNDEIERCDDRQDPSALKELNAGSCDQLEKLECHLPSWGSGCEERRDCLQDKQPHNFHEQLKAVPGLKTKRRRKRRKKKNRYSGKELSEVDKLKGHQSVLVDVSVSSQRESKDAWNEAPLTVRGCPIHLGADSTLVSSKTDKCLPVICQELKELKVQSHSRQLSQHKAGSLENETCSLSSNDGFFLKFKEHFLRNNETHKPNTNISLENQKILVFEGIDKAIFDSFQKKLHTNVQKEEKGNYSSSSDDEDDILDQAVWRLKYGVLSLPVFGLGLDSESSSELEYEDGGFLCIQKCPSSPVFTKSLIQVDEDGVSKSAKISTCVDGSELLNTACGDKKSSLKERYKALTCHITHDLCPSVAGAIPLEEAQKKEFRKINQNTSLPSRHCGEAFQQLKITDQQLSSSPFHAMKAINFNMYDSEDYLKSQMVFFEDISSESDSNDTIIMENYMDKEHLCIDSSANQPSLPSSSEYTPEFLELRCSQSSPPRFTTHLLVPDIKKPNSKITSTLIRKNLPSMRHHRTKLKGLNQQLYAKNNFPGQSKPTSTTKGIGQLFDKKRKHRQSSETSLDYRGGSALTPKIADSNCEMLKSVSKITELNSERSHTTHMQEKTNPTRDFHEGNQNVGDLSNIGVQLNHEKPSYAHNIPETRQQSPTSTKDFVTDLKTQLDSVKQESEVKLKIAKSTSTFQDNFSLKDRKNLMSRDTTFDICETDEATIELEIEPVEVCLKLEHEKTPGSKTAEEDSPDWCNELDTSVSADLGVHRVRRHGKSMKKSKRDKGSQMVSRRKLIQEGNSSSNEEDASVTDNYEVSKSQCLRQRKQTLYYTDLFDSSENNTSVSSDEEFNSRSSKQKGSKNRKTKGAGFKVKNVKKTNQNFVEADKVTKNGFKTGPSRGRKKKSAGGDKLLNSLSLLHMATLANLTEVQLDPDPPARQSLATVSFSVASPRSHYSDRANSDHSATFTPVLEQMSFISPQNSDELDVSPPVVSSPTDKNWKLKRSRAKRSEDSSAYEMPAPRRLASLKPGCNGASNLGSKPLQFNRFHSNSASPVPSNFLFSHPTDSTTQRSESAHQSEETEVSSTLQLLETRRAQVNCTSFSMKDILRLATTDDSMDSDSKDSTALVKPPEPKRAQVKSTTLSMNDIMKLTSTDKTPEMETTHSLFSQLPNPGLCSFKSCLGNSEAGKHEESKSQCKTSDTHITSLTELKEDTSEPSSDKFVPVSRTSSFGTNLSEKSYLVETLHERLSGSSGSRKLVENLLRIKSLKPVANIHSDSLIESSGAKSDASYCVNTENAQRSHDEKDIQMALDGELDPVNDILNTIREQDILQVKTLSGEIRKDDTCIQNFKNSEKSSLQSERKCHKMKKKAGKISQNWVLRGGGKNELSTSSSSTSPRPQLLKLLLSRGTSSVTGLPQYTAISHEEQPERLAANSAQNMFSNEVLPVKITVGSKTPLNTDEKLLESSTSADTDHHNDTPNQYSSKIRISRKMLPISTSSILTVPKISITSEDSPQLKTSEDSNNSQSVAADQHMEYLKSVTQGIKPLYPLQIPPYSYLAPGFSFPLGQAFPNSINTSSLYLPYSWQWNTPSSESAQSPLNLCTLQHKLLHGYSPITPPSPLSPVLSPGQNSASLCDMSPPLKKAKPLWYPWLNVDSQKGNSWLASGDQNLRKCAENSGQLLEDARILPSKMDDTTFSEAAGVECKNYNNINLKEIKIKESLKPNLPLNGKQKEDFVVDLPTSNSHVDRMIDVMTEQRMSGKVSLFESDSSKVVSGRKEIPGKLEIPCKSLSVCDSEKKFTCDTFENHIFEETYKCEVDFLNTLLTEHGSGTDLLQTHICDRRNLLLHKDSQGSSSGCSDDKQSLVIMEAAGGEKLPKSEHQNKGTPTSENSPSKQMAQKQGTDKSKDDKQETKRQNDKEDGGDEEQEKIQAGFNEGDVTLCPVEPPPSWSAVEKSLPGLGLNTVVPPAPFCSNLEDLPERLMEHGGRVLKVESKRVCDLSPFTPSEHIIGIRYWRSQLLLSSSLMTAESQGGSLLERLEQEPQLQFLLAADEMVVACPVRTPPSRANVTKWLKEKMSSIKTTLLAPKTDINGNCTLDVVITDDNQASESLPSSSELISSLTMSHQKATGEDKQRLLSKFSSPHEASLSEGHSSLHIDTDLDMSSSSAVTSSQLSSRCAHVPPLVSQNELKPEQQDLVQKLKRKRKLKFVEEADIESVQGPELDTLEEHYADSKKANVDLKSFTRKHASSTPFKQSADILCDPSFTPFSSPLEKTRPYSPKDEAIVDCSPVPLLRHISTNTENLLQKTYLNTQTPRQSSAAGLNDVSQIEGPTPKNTFGFRVAQTHLQDSKSLHKFQYVTALSLELHIETRGDLRPDPEFDAILAVFYSVWNDTPPQKGVRSMTGVIIVDSDAWLLEQNKEKVAGWSSHHDQTSAGAGGSSADENILWSDQKPGCSKALGSDDSASARSFKSATETVLEKCGIEGLKVQYVKDEVDLMNAWTDLVTQLDPDIFVGFEIQMLSWGYLLQRAAHLNMDLCSKLSRVKDAKKENHFSSEKDEWGSDHMSEIHVAGRIVLNLWRILRHEITLNLYSFENVAFHVLHQRVPLYSFRTLQSFFQQHTLHRWRVFEHYLIRVKGQLDIIDHLDIIGKSSEFARVFGLEFYDVLARGSQIRVESMMLRLAKPMNFVPVSPSVHQRAQQRAPECIPLNLEPESKYYTSPVAVLDFQSLYPSIMIAYNYCFTTCLGRLDMLDNAHEGPFQFGCTSLNISPATLKEICDKVTISPNGVVFLKSSVRKGILPIMVEEILNTRLMVKKSMKSYKDDKILTRMLDARQLSLKLIANVTYGYTGANFSGRMPCIEVGDSIVRKARESLERAIQLVENTPKWRARVVYGDTDSMFIHFPGRSMAEAFALGQEIADTVTAMFPKPIKLRFEKIYLPCVLQTKKRYVGFMYETPDQKEPVYDAKGIETVRRDSCSAVSKVLERSIKVLFTTHDLSRVKAYVTRQLHKLLEGKVNIIDLIFAKEYRGLMGYKPGACIPALDIARKRLRQDRRAEPRVGERVPYVIVHGCPGMALIQLVREPAELVADASLRLNAQYYITKQILPPLDRIFSLIGVSVFKWYSDMPKIVRVGHVTGMLTAASHKQGTISQFFATSNCPVCDVQTKRVVCESCAADPQLSVLTLTSKIRDWEKTFCQLAQICDGCQGVQDHELRCVSIDCPIMFRRVVASQDLHKADNLHQVLNKYLLDF